MAFITQGCLSMRQKFVMANWKMHGSKNLVATFCRTFTENYEPKPAISVVIFPPAIYAHEFQIENVTLGGQNFYPEDKGAFTGEHSLPMFKEYNFKYVLVGHSERRNIFKEDENFVAKKFHDALEHDIIPVLCIGESLSERESGNTEEVLTSQLQAVLSIEKTAFRNAVIAYEPVWAIGTGRTASAEQINSVHSFIRQFIAEYDVIAAQNTSVLYGGSINETNAKEIFALPDVDGGLVGGASLDPLKFAEIVKCIN